MDFKIKGIGWVGGIYRKFETLCHEMDNIVNQDTVKYAENQGKSVGKSMKRFYSDVVLPLKHEGQGVALKRSATIDTSFELKVAIQEDHINTVCNLSHVEPVAVDTIEKQLDHASNELCPLAQLSFPTSVDSLDGAESGISSQQLCDAMKTTSSVVSIEENPIREKAYGFNVPDLISLREEESFGDSTNNKFIDCTEKISPGAEGEVSRAMLIHDMESQLPRKETGISDNIGVDVVNRQLECAFGDLFRVDQPVNLSTVDSHLGKQSITSEEPSEALNDTKLEVNLEEYPTMEKPSVSKVSGLVPPFEKETLGASLLSKFNDSNDKEMSFEAEVSPTTSVQDVRKPSASDVSKLIFPGEEGIVNCDNKNPSLVHTDFSSATSAHGNQNERKTKDECVSDALGDVTSAKMASLVIGCEEDMAEVGVGSSSLSLFKEFYLAENSLESSPAKTFIYHDPVNVAELVSHNVHSSSLLMSLLSDEKELKVAASISSSNDLSMASVGNGAYRTVNSFKSLTGISGNKNLHFGGESPQLQVSSSSNIGHVDDSNDDINFSSMETIDLYDEVKLEDSCVIPDSSALYSVSRRINKHKSYRKRIQDALTSRKRLAKEYEQLAIWFGDADMGSVHDHFQTQQPSSSTPTSEPKNSQTELVCDSDWEIL
ncbi:Fiber Fb32-like protein isoform 3 [Hibiscus syriacus]|uniref:Fiber Fb32-like protein isoform 3 n=1 Tax=Hibiscus syriacus TaxID=106335 RepID=A0A6A2ZJP4_HIBSY|nr:Fiber Fb32-like protein isoform 3 [Hibiscus syriacus]